MKDKIKADLKKSMMAKDGARSILLKSLISEMTYAEKASNKPAVSDADMSTVLFRAIKKRQDSVEQFSKAGRMDLADKEKSEIDMVMEYLPKQMSENEVRDAVKALILKLGVTGPKDMGKVMKAAKSEIDPAKAPASLVAKAVQDLLKSL